MNCFRYLLIIAVSISLISFSYQSNAQHFEANPTEGCGPLEVELINLHPSNAYIPHPTQTTGFTYSWDFGGGNISDEENPEPVVFTNPGIHSINYNVTVDTIGFKLTQIHITDVACDDPDIWPFTNDPDIYIEIVDGSSSVILSTFDQADDNTCDPDACNIMFTFPEITLNNPPYFLRVKDKDSSDDDDNCIDGEESENAGTLITLPANNVTGFGDTSIDFTNGGLAFTAHYNKTVFEFSQSVNIEVFPKPSAPSLQETNLSTCVSTEPISITAQGNNVEWYSDEDLTILVIADNTMEYTPLNTGTFTFYAVQYDAVTSCRSNAIQLNINVGNINPPNVENDSLSFCYGQIIPPIIVSGNQISWYSDENLTNLIHQGDTLELNDLEIGEYDYFVIQSDTAGLCVSESQKIHISVINSIEASVSSTDVSCFGNNDGTAEIEVLSGDAPYTINWSNGSQGANLNGATAGEYSATIIDANFCVATVNTIIGTPSELFVNNDIIHVSCYGANDATASIIVSGSVPPYTYAWNDQNTDSIRNNMEPGNYSITVTDSHSCVVSKEISISQPDTLAFSATTLNESCRGASDGEIHLTVSGGTEPYSYSWPHNMYNPIATNLKSALYEITVTDNNNCVINQTVDLKADYDFCLVPASVITPNGDGKNDVWTIRFMEMYLNVHVMIFNRNGKKVYENTAYANDWDGTLNGKPLPIGSYYYIIDLNTDDEPFTGYVDILR
jgi:gliding motility-associated-like protein